MTPPVSRPLASVNLTSLTKAGNELKRCNWGGRFFQCHLSEQAIVVFLTGRQFRVRWIRRRFDDLGAGRIQLCRFLELALRFAEDCEGIERHAPFPGGMDLHAQTSWLSGFFFACGCSLVGIMKNSL
jgi:hypothetical protein